MSDHEETAREIAHGTCTYKDLEARITAALKAAERDALERAAIVADNREDYCSNQHDQPWQPEWCYRRDEALLIGDEIRTLIPKEDNNDD